MPVFPSKFEFRCAGISLIIAAILWMIGFWLMQVDHDLWNVATDEQVIILHKELSSSDYRAKVEFSCVLFWISFPLVLAGLHGIKRLSDHLFEGTPGIIIHPSPVCLFRLRLITCFHHKLMDITNKQTGALLMYIAEKSFILGLGLATVLIPAIALTAISYDWDNVDTTDYTDGAAPAGYWIQCYLMIFWVEVVDCLTICDAGFMVTYYLAALYFSYGSKKGRNKRWEDTTKIIHGMGLFRMIKFFVEILTGFCCISLSIVFLMILFQFGESGFFAPTSRVNAGFLVIWSFICKIFIGFRLVQCSKETYYVRLKRLYGDKTDGDDKILSNQTEENYKMETIDVKIDNEDNTTQ